jgi:hypothetical protein
VILGRGKRRDREESKSQEEKEEGVIPMCPQDQGYIFNGGRGYTFIGGRGVSWLIFGNAIFSLPSILALGSSMGVSPLELTSKPFLF